MKVIPTGLDIALLEFWKDVGLKRSSMMCFKIGRVQFILDSQFMTGIGKTRLCYYCDLGYVGINIRRRPT